jgi:hypothetical protein
MSIMVTKTEWTESAGGPLLLASRGSLRYWHGVDNPEGRSETSDYERACGVEDEIGVIPVGSESALVLGQEPDRTALILIQASSEVLIVRWRWALSEEALLSRLWSEHTARTLSFASNCKFQASAGEYVLFDSACSGARLDSYLSVSLRTGAYLVETSTLNPDRELYALVHRLRPLVHGGMRPRAVC